MRSWCHSDRPSVVTATPSGMEYLRSTEYTHDYGDLFVTV